MFDAPHPKSLTTLFVGFQDQDNLGLRYLMGAAKAGGHRVGIETFSTDADALVARALKERPDFIGFSLIFQYMTGQFAEVIDALRKAGVTSHIAVGGHFPSFDYETVLSVVEGADSVIRFEGEATLMDLLDRLGQGQDWRDLPGLVARLEDGSLKANPLRKQIMDLDTVPWPERADISYEAADQPTAAILGSRGCPWNCDFCSIRPFYEAQEGSLRRLRSPEDVMEEMRHLYHARGVALFLFQDDDFLATGARARKWAGTLSDLIVDSDIGGKVAWKMSCRSDELRPDIIARMLNGGLTHVYMGVESGDVQGLKNMKKMMSPQKHIEAGNMLRAAGLSFDFGFMLMDPWSDIRMIRSNIAFLDDFVGDGWAVAGFCRMLPYSGTPVERKLKAEGRLTGTGFEPDYRFLDPKLDRYYAWLLETFHTRNFTNQGLAHLLRGMIFESRLQSPQTRWMTEEETRWLQYITARANQSAFVTLGQALDYIDRTPLDEIVTYGGFLGDLTQRELAEQHHLTRQLEAFWSEPSRQIRRRARHDAWLGGGFERSWTHAEPSWETQGIGVR
ncbi:B12-binding domain-containing radical SAM protein [Litoreibacter roseus]|uniref:Uncharacterized protein n=1 Tax=Litoreibacter roseus TaxID=2601869 RepID=A0A6N6JMW6_9RHOB|nr:radical SAM protein [Litoreibacter roseus]GFE66819.1 hypothetical protein KIN_38930 [Litoreibacter roseus]